MMKFLVFLVLVAVIFDSFGSQVPEIEENRARSQMPSLFNRLGVIASKCLRVEEGDATAADRAFLESNGGAAAASLMNPLGEGESRRSTVVGDEKQ